MIGVAIPVEQHPIAREFFELCKTPWEFWHPHRQYAVLLCSQDLLGPPCARVTVRYAGPAPADEPAGASVTIQPTVLAYRHHRLPIYGACRAFLASSTSSVSHMSGGASAVQIGRQSDVVTIDVGYDLFTEVSVLLTHGQPVTFARCPTMELHIKLLRELVTGAGLPWVEIPPSPEGFAFTACLTHDVDHPVQRNHWGDRTMAGFLYRATAGSLIQMFRGRISFRKLWRNWSAVARLPFVYLGWADDEWLRFDRYVSMEGGRPSTFFVIPKRGVAGNRRTGPAPSARGCRYQLSELGRPLATIISTGGEVAVHGIDSWMNAEAGLEERAQMALITGANDRGVRMHWLYFDTHSPLTLEAAGYRYDSTVGYNQTVGYRAGTTQVFRPPETTTLLELPLHVMDTALFYPDYLNLSATEAHGVVSELIENAANLGGALTFNWHDRSIAPERLWDDFYRELLHELQDRQAWFATAGRAVAWFDQRRSAVFRSVSSSPGTLKICATFSAVDSTLPSLKVRVYKPRLAETESLASGSDEGFIDYPLNNNIELTVTL